MTPEGKIKAAFMKEAKTQKLFVVPMELARVKGIPDKVTVLHGGAMAWVEFKDGNEPLSREQEIMRKLLRRLEHSVYVVRSKKEAIDLALFLGQFNRKLEGSQ